MFFIEVGSCDFDTCERLIKNNWNGIVIEPVKYYFDKLPKYSNIFYENIAIDSKKDNTIIKYIDPNVINKDNKWLAGISSINNIGSININYNKKLYENSIISQPIKTNTLNNICNKYNIKEIDFLKIDAEGHDLIILKTIDLTKIYVKTIKIEHKHLNSNEIKEYLQKYNYLIYEEQNDIYAIK